MAASLKARLAAVHFVLFQRFHGRYPLSEQKSRPARHELVQEQGAL
jgi:hypothetical protein